MHTTQGPDLFATCRDCFSINDGNKNTVVDEKTSFSQRSMSSLLVFNAGEIESCFPPLNDSKSFDTVDFDAHIKTNRDYSINHVFKYMTFKNWVLYFISVK